MSVTSKLTSKRFYSYSVEPPVCDDDALFGISTYFCTLYVPAQSLEMYKAAEQWKEFYHIEVPEVVEIHLDQTTVTITRGETLQLHATVIPAAAYGTVLTWTSSDENIATVSENGLVTAVSAGTATITVSSGNISATCEIEVKDNDGVDDVYMDGSHNVEVYTLQGIRLNISTRDELTNLPAGLYIVNGKKIFLK